MHPVGPQSTIGIGVWLAGLAAVTAGAQPIWEYQLQAGDHLVYERRVTTSSAGSRPAAQPVGDRIDLWCLEKRDREAFLLLTVASGTGQPRASLSGAMAYIDEWGRRRWPDVMRVRAADVGDAWEILPILRTPLQAPDGWLTPPDLAGLARYCTRADPERHCVAFAVDYPRGVGEALGRARRGRYWFDPDTGVATRIETVDEDQATGARREAVFLLVLRERRPGAWTDRRADEAGRYLMTSQHEERLLADVVEQPRQVERTIERLDRLWAGRLTDFERRADSPCELLARARRTHLLDRADDLRADARYAIRWQNQPAIAWSLPTVTGDSLTSEQLRDRPTIECLWSTEQPDFLATLDALADVQRQVVAGRVRVVCLNLDADAHRAQRVIACLESPLTHLLAGPLRTVDAPPRLPVARVLDRHGIIRRVWIGSRPDYAAALAEAQRWSD